MGEEWVGLALCGRGEPSSRSALDDEEFVEAAFDGAVEEGRAFGGSQADEFRGSKVAGEEVDAPADATGFQPGAELGIKHIQIGLGAESDAIGGIHDDSARFLRRSEVEQICLSDRNVAGDSGAGKLFCGGLHGAGIPI